MNISSQYILDRTQHRPTIGIICGSGLGKNIYWIEHSMRPTIGIICGSGIGKKLRNLIGLIFIIDNKEKIYLSSKVVNLN